MWQHFRCKIRKILLKVQREKFLRLKFGFRNHQYINEKARIFAGFGICGAERARTVDLLRDRQRVKMVFCQ